MKSHLEAVPAFFLVGLEGGWHESSLFFFFLPLNLISHEREGGERGRKAAISGGNNPRFFAS